MDIWTIITYVLAALFNIGVVSKARSAAFNAGRSFLSSGRFAWIAIFILSFLQLLVAGQFAAFQDAKSFVELLQNASSATVAILGAHSIWKTAGNK